MVALFTRAWIEIALQNLDTHSVSVALFTRAWIEITETVLRLSQEIVALFTRAWIEILHRTAAQIRLNRRPLHEGVD